MAWLNPNPVRNRNKVVLVLTAEAISVTSVFFSSLVSAQAQAPETNPFIIFGMRARQGVSEFPSLVTAPSGNGDLKAIPEFPRFTMLRLGASGAGVAVTEQGRTQLAIEFGTRKIPQIMRELREEGMLVEVQRVAKKFGLDPMHILGPILGENTFNGAIDRTMQNSYHRMFRDSDIRTMSARMQQMVAGAEAQRCLAAEISNYWKWRCVVFYSATTTNNTNSDLLYGFYSISNPGGTFGVAQMQPFLLWSLNDVVVSRMGYPAFAITEFEHPLKALYDKREILAYIAANAQVSIDLYKQIAGVDISKNPGLTTTLFNVGDEYQRAHYMKVARTRVDAKALPRVNYMGWYINYHEKLIRAEMARTK